MKILKTTLVLALLLMLTPTNASAQDNTVFTVTTWKITIPENGSQAELASLLDEFQKKVVLPNDKIISERAMRHLSGSDSRDLVFVTEYANWNDVEAASVKQGELINSAWKTENDRDAFFKKFNKYFVMHTDEMFSGLSNLDKK